MLQVNWAYIVQPNQQTTGNTPRIHTRADDQRDPKCKMEDLGGDFNDKITQINAFSATEFAILLAAIQGLHVSYRPMIS